MDNNTGEWPIFHKDDNVDNGDDFDNEDGDDDIFLWMMVLGDEQNFKRGNVKKGKIKYKVGYQTPLLTIGFRIGEFVLGTK